MRPVLVLEINEIPWRLLDRYVHGANFANIRRFLEGSHHYTSIAQDTGELSPWVTWPTMHRGVNNETHRVANLGQDPSTFRGSTIWEDLLEHGIPVGICGAMQSWPPRPPGKGGFYLPDTFAHDASAIPSYLQPIQQFNLSQVKKNPRVVSRALPTISEIALVARAFQKGGVRFATMARICQQLLSERFFRQHALRRPVFQALLFWDVFRRHFEWSSPPGYSSFFTNHIAGVMHRFWKDVFPEDFPETNGLAGDNEPLMSFAFSVLDDIIADVLSWQKANTDIAVILASSMGQGPVHRDYHEGIELHVQDVSKLLQAAGVTRNSFKPLLAMVPQVAAEFHSPIELENARNWLENVRTLMGRPLFSTNVRGLSLSITVRLPSKEEISSGYVEVLGARLPHDELGLRAQAIDAGTGYHIPEGVLCLYGKETSQEPDQSRTAFPATRYKRWVMSLVEHGVHRPDLLLAQ